MSTNALTKTNGNAGGAAAATDIMAYAGSMTREQVQLVKTSIITGGTRPVTDNELALFLTVCARRGLDPFSGQVYGIMRKSKDRQGNWTEQLVIQVGIDGYRLLAESTGKYEGMVGPFWCGPDGQWREVWLDSAPPSAAKVGVYRTGCREPFWGVATFREYAQTYDGKPTGKWKDMPATMLAKCAESAAIRKAFPQAVGGVTTPEMAGADTDTYEVTEGDRETARLVDTRRAEQDARPRTPWVEEIDGQARVVPAQESETAPPTAVSAAAPVEQPADPAPDVVLEAIAAAATVAAVEAATRREDFDAAQHQVAANARIVAIVNGILDVLDWSTPGAAEKKLALAAPKLDRMPADTPGLNLALDKLNVARDRLATPERTAA